MSYVLPTKLEAHSECATVEGYNGTKCACQMSDGSKVNLTELACRSKPKYIPQFLSGKCK